VGRGFLGWEKRVWGFGEGGKGVGEVRGMCCGWDIWSMP